MDKRTRAEKVIEILEQVYPDAVCCLTYNEPYQLMIAARLSAQCTDARVNTVTPALFERFPTIKSFADADTQDIEDIIKSCGLYKTKALSIKQMCSVLWYELDGVLPDTVEELVKLPGIGRKTANLLVGDVFGKPAIVCDTHCIRISGRLGFTKSKDPAIVEKDLKIILPPDKSSDLCHRFVLFGRDTCTARKPDCEHCPIRANVLCEAII